MPMDPLRMSQIREALDADKLAQGQAFDIVKRWVSTQQEEAAEYQQLNQEDIDSAGELVSEFQELLENKLNELTHRIRTNSGEAPASDSWIGLVEDVINAYNKIISIANNPVNTQQTKEALMTTVMKSEATIKRIEVLLVHILERMTRSYNPAIQKPGFGAFLKAYNVYNLISKQLTSKQLVSITPGDLQANLRAILASRRDWAAIMRRYGIKEPNYDPIDPGAPGPPGPPGGPQAPQGPGPGGTGDDDDDDDGYPRRPRDTFDWYSQRDTRPPDPPTDPGDINPPSDETGVRPTTLGPTAHAPADQTATAPEATVRQPQTFNMDTAYLRLVAPICH